MSKQYKMSASSIQAFKACPMRFRLAYREGLRRDKDTEALRMGTAWHLLHEVYRNAINEVLTSKHSVIVDGVLQNDDIRQIGLEAVIDALNEHYETLMDNLVREEAERERQILISSFAMYLWYYQDDDLDYLCQEIQFELPIQGPHGLNLPLDKIKRVGKIDHLIRWNGHVGVLERKSTSKGIDAGSDFWNRSQKDTQVSMYALALEDLKPDLADHGVELREDDVVGNTIYDVWKKPTIKPKALSQKDTATFLETGEYHGQKFTVADHEDSTPEKPRVVVNDRSASMTLGKSGKPAIFETIEMFGARLEADIMDRPEYFFQRREIPRTQKQLDKFRAELYNLYATQLNFERADTWYENENQCKATFHCEFIPICYGPGADAVCDNETTPEGFKRIFVDLTKEGQTVSEE